MMDKFNISAFAFLLVKVGFIYGLMKIIITILLYYAKQQNVKWQKRWVTNADVLLTPIAVCLVIILCFFENPLWTCLLVLLIYLGFSATVTDYFLGINYKLNQKLVKGTIIEYQGHEGTLVEFSPVGIWIKSDKGIHFINYQSLHHHGYIVKNNSFISNNYMIRIRLPEDKKVRINDLKSLIYGSPYLDSDRNADIKLIDDRMAEIKINLRSIEYKYAFEEFLEESNYSIIK